MRPRDGSGGNTALRRQVTIKEVAPPTIERRKNKQPINKTEPRPAHGGPDQRMPQGAHPPLTAESRLGVDNAGKSFVNSRPGERTREIVICLGVNLASESWSRSTRNPSNRHHRRKESIRNAYQAEPDLPGKVGNIGDVAKDSENLTSSR